ncbi:MAG: hypothetical protein ACJ8BW_02650 [Ktedonobacteraceae bacterium]
MEEVTEREFWLADPSPLTDRSPPKRFSQSSEGSANAFDGRCCVLSTIGGALCATEDRHASGNRQTARAGEPALLKLGDDPSSSFSPVALSHLSVVFRSIHTQGP